MKNTPFDLTGKVAVITGSSRGIGRSSAELLAKLGAKVVISSRKADACEEVASGINKSGGDAHVIACNISRREEVEALISGTVKHYGPIDILVCNAAVNPYYGPLLDIPDEAFDKIMGSNVKSNIWLCAQAIPPMAARGNGSVVIISSIGGLRGSTVIGAYGISKAADFALCRSLAGEWGPKGVRVNCVAPGLVKTDFRPRIVGRRRAAETPLRHHAAAADRRARRDRRRRRLSFLRRLELHDRPDHCRRRRRHHRGGVISSPSPRSCALLRGVGWGEGLLPQTLKTINAGEWDFVSRTRCSVLHDAPQSRDPHLHRTHGPRISSAPQERCAASGARRWILTNHLQSACLGATASQQTSREATPCPMCWPSIRAPHPRARLCFDRTFPSPPRRRLNSRSIFPPRAGSSTSPRTSGPQRSPPAARR